MRIVAMLVVAWLAGCSSTADDQVEATYSPLHPRVLEVDENRTVTFGPISMAAAASTPVPVQGRYYWVVAQGGNGFSEFVPNTTRHLVAEVQWDAPHGMLLCLTPASANPVGADAESCVQANPVGGSPLSLTLDGPAPGEWWITAQPSPAGAVVEAELALTQYKVAVPQGYSAFGP